MSVLTAIKCTVCRKKDLSNPSAPPITKANGRPCRCRHLVRQFETSTANRFHPEQRPGIFDQLRLNQFRFLHFSQIAIDFELAKSSSPWRWAQASEVLRLTLQHPPGRFMPYAAVDYASMTQADPVTQPRHPGGAATAFPDHRMASLGQHAMHDHTAKVHENPLTAVLTFDTQRAMAGLLDSSMTFSANERT